MDIFTPHIMLIFFLKRDVNLLDLTAFRYLSFLKFNENSTTRLNTSNFSSTLK